MADSLAPGAAVQVPFGRGDRLIEAYVIEISSQPEIDPARIKDIYAISPGNLPVEGKLIRLAFWMKEQYGASMIQCLKTVMPVTKKVKPVKKREIRRQADPEEYSRILETCRRKHQAARVRLLEGVPAYGSVPYEEVITRLHLTAAVIRAMADAGAIAVEEKNIMRGPVGQKDPSARQTLTAQQADALAEISRELFQEEQPGKTVLRRDSRPVLLHGITGSGKTLIYMELIEKVQKMGLQTIVLIPEIALTWQTVLRFWQRFGDRVSFINSRLSQGERYDQLCRAKNGEIDIMIGPRSAVFTPFRNLGLIIIDEEHESAYKSETAPRYHTRDVAAARAAMCGGGLVLGSATPSLESAYRAQTGRYHLVRLDSRAAAHAVLPGISIVDMRSEMLSGNKTMFSRLLYEKINDRLQKGEQIMLFLNRRGYSNFVSCRSCGEAVRCPHCSVSLTLHRNGRLVCHYCGYQIPMVKTCPVCGSPYVAGFGTGTEKVEEKLHELFPQARILRMDMDTTQGKNGHERIITAFANEEADILIGTQMIVKGHDFSKVTLVGALAADTSLYASDFRAGERTFQLLVQAAGRAGRSSLPGEMIIQTYKPDHYSITSSAGQDYDTFYGQELSFRKMMHYPPVCSMAEIIFSSPAEDNAREAARMAADMLRRNMDSRHENLLGPQAAPVSKMNDIYYYHFFLRTSSRRILSRDLEKINQWMKDECRLDVLVQFDIK